MVFLSELADRIRNEIDSWPTQTKMSVRVLVDRNLQDARAGDWRSLTEALVLPVGLHFIGSGDLEIGISGTDERIRITFRSGYAIPGKSLSALQEGFSARNAEWMPEIESCHDSVTVTLSLPALTGNPPVDAAAMAGETGISTMQAEEILRGFFSSTRVHLDVLQGKGAGHEERFRAAHSLKGAARAVRAHELAAAAGTLERAIGEMGDTEEGLDRLKAAWNRIEQWFKGAGIVGKSVLYAEDEFTNRKIMEVQCRKFGVNCVLVEDGRQALDRCGMEHFDLVILDQYMPELNGDEVARELRRRFPALPLVAITSDDSCIPRLKASGFDAVYVKPLNAGDYRELMETHLL